MTAHTLAIVALCWCLASVTIAAVWCIAVEAVHRAGDRAGDRRAEAAWDAHIASAPGMVDLRELSCWDAAAVVGMAPFFSEWAAETEAER